MTRSILIILLALFTNQSYAQLIPVENNNRWGYVDIQGHVKIPFQYRTACAFSEGLAAVRTFGSYGYIDSLGNAVLPQKYDYVSNFNNGKAIVRNAGKNYLIDKKGDELLSFEGKEAELRNGYILYHPVTSKYVEDKIISFSGKELLSKGEWFYHTTFDYPFLIVYNKQHDYYLKDTLGKRIAYIGKFSSEKEVVRGNLFSRTLVRAYPMPSYNYKIPVYPPDSIKIFNQNGVLIKSITPKEGYYFEDKYRNHAHDGYYCISQVSKTDSSQWIVDVYEPSGELKVSFNPNEEEYNFINENCVVHRKNGIYQMRDSVGNILLDNITTFSYRGAYFVKNPKMYVWISDEIEALVDTKGNIDTLPETSHNFIGYNNATNLLVFDGLIYNQPAEINYRLSTHETEENSTYVYWFYPEWTYTIATYKIIYRNKSGETVFKTNNSYSNPTCCDTIYPLPNCYYNRDINYITSDLI